MPRTDIEYRYGVRYSFSGNMDRVEDWLDTNCVGSYSYKFQAIKETDSIFNKLEILFHFERESDRMAFKELITSGRAPW